MGNPGEMGMGGDSDHDESAEESQGVIHIPSDMLPEGMAAKCKPGDILEFKVTGAVDQDGDVPVEYNYGDEGGDKGEEGSSWEDDLRHEMSPRTPEAEDTATPM